MKTKSKKMPEPRYAVGLRYLTCLEYEGGRLDWGVGKITAREFVPGEGWRYFVHYEGDGVADEDNWLPEDLMMDEIGTTLDEDETCAEPVAA